MSLVCTRCGTQNPDGNQFCQACGTPLAAGAAAPIGATAASPFPPPATPVGPPYVAAPFGTPPPYQSPYYAPAPGAPQPPVHRTPWVLIVSIVIGLIVVMAGGAAVLGAIAIAKNNAQSHSFQPLSSPSPAGTPTPGVSPTPTHSTGPTVSNPNVTVPEPSGWTLVNKDSETITLESPNADGSITIGSGPSSPTQTAQQNKDTIDKYFEGKYPDTKSCPNTKTTTGSMAGVAGIFWELCFTLTSGGQAAQAGAPLFVGANSSGSVYYAVFLITTQKNMDNFVVEATPIMKAIQWQLQ